MMPSAKVACEKWLLFSVLFFRLPLCLCSLSGLESETACSLQVQGD